MPGRTVAEKMGIKEGWRSYVGGAPAGVLESLGMPALDLRPDLAGDFDYLHLFVRTVEEMHKCFPRMRAHLAPAGKLWVSWPKAGRLGSDLSLPKVIEIGYDCGLVESTCLRIDETWAGLRFTHPKPGKAYDNSFGRLPNQQDVVDRAR